MTEVPRGRQGHWPASSTHASISCRDCRKRKIKRDRSLPTCFVCLKNGQECSYPVGPLKPGPKIGSSRRRMARRKVDTSCHCKQGVCGSLDAQSQPDLCHQSSQSSEPQQGFDYIGLPSPGSEDPPPTGLDSDERTSVPSTTTNGSSVRVSSLFWILHPSHDVKLDPNSSTRPPMTSGECPMRSFRLCKMTCVKHLEQHSRTWNPGLSTFSLFHQPTFTEKLLQIDSKHDLYALLAAMFSFSSRYRSQPVQATESRQVDKDKNLPTSEEFLNLAYEYTSTAFNAYADEPPSMSLLQAVVLTTFAELIKGVRARAWRSVGTCVRVAYERQLHLIDADSEPGTIQAETWVVEEQRRTWWAIWELDVFASTVRRSPTAIDWDTNETFLPVDDEFWFACTPQPSCFLERDPEMRWKSLQASKNLSPKAWFIAINSIMRNAQVLSNPRGGARNVAVRRDPSAPSRHPPKALKTSS
ncbi:unnamed protein product [Clonostachys rosea f. rosea IK726]|uniref:Uncharacterized protein n=1 Tax=Clonostachys rosea f. rosea IK726 TaxID=1349383 RepID=A0ACA9UF41_BIOOC|nr:unnamed protein product [Clonostachys rosea f. rosea IK726]